MRTSRSTQHATRSSSWADDADAVREEVRREALSAHDEERVACCVDLEVRIRFLRGDPAGARAANAERAHSIHTMGDPWRRTMQLAFEALVAAAIDPDAEAHAAARAFADAYARVPQDEAFTIHAMHLATRLLTERGLGDAADSIRAAIAMREERVRRGMRT